MQGKDLTEKILEDYNDIFADIVNVLVFGGETCVKSGELKDIQTHSQYKDDKGKLHEQERDIAKLWSRRNIKLAVYGVENQSEIDNRMALRVFGYEGASYRAQYKNKKVAPVITIILYFGNRHWKNKRNLNELLNVPEGLDNLVNDIHINVYEIAWLTEEQLSQFKSDFGIVARFFVERRRNKDYIPNDKRRIKHIDEVLKLLSVMTGDSRYEKILSDGKEITNMCEVAERLEQRGLKRGREEGREALIINMYKNGMALSQIAAIAECSEKMIRGILKKYNAE